MIYRAKFMWREAGNVIATATIGTTFKGEYNKAAVDAKLWRKFNGAYPDAMQAAIVARWTFDPPPTFYKPHKAASAEHPRAVFACHALPAVILAGMTPVESWCFIGKLMLAAWALLVLAITLYRRFRGKWTPSDEACPRCVDVKLRKMETEYGTLFECERCGRMSQRLGPLSWAAVRDRRPADLKKLVFRAAQQ